MCVCVSVCVCVCECVCVLCVCVCVCVCYPLYLLHKPEINCSVIGGRRLGTHFPV